MRRIEKLLLCLSMLLALALPVMAQEGEGTTPPTTHTHSWDAGTGSDATCTQGGSKTYTCTTCSATKTETANALGHTYGSWSQVDAATHKRTCSVCSHEESASHGLSTTSTNTCVAAGVKTISCSSCGYSATETVAATGVHTYGNWTIAEGTHSAACSVCADVKSGTHTYTSTVTTEASCKAAGKLTKKCSVCGKTAEEDIPKLTTHTYTNDCDGDCNVCGESRTPAHKKAAVWSKDGSGHWHSCASCKEKLDFADHFPGPAATEEKAQICLTCGYTLTSRLNHEHAYAQEWTADESGHWYACATCEEQKDFQAHLYEDACDPECDVCGFKTGNAHVFDGTWHSDEDGHWFVCSNCGGVAEAKDHVFSSDVPDTQERVCTDCAYVVVPTHVHTYAEEWQKDEHSHWQQCECGERDAAADHVWEASETKNTERCQVCGQENAVIPKEPNSDFPWLLIFIILLIALIGAVAALIGVLKPKKKKR